MRYRSCGLAFANLCGLFYSLIMKKIRSTAFERWLGRFSSGPARSGKIIRGFRPKFSVQKNITFSNVNRIANKFARAFKNFKPLKF